eukprot:16803-Heterococcus_DN1.PRE.2
MKGDEGLAECLNAVLIFLVGLRKVPRPLEVLLMQLSSKKKLATPLKRLWKRALHSLGPQQQRNSTTVACARQEYDTHYHCAHVVYTCARADHQQSRMVCQCPGAMHCTGASCQIALCKDSSTQLGTHYATHHNVFVCTALGGSSSSYNCKCLNNAVTWGPVGSSRSTAGTARWSNDDDVRFTFKYCDWSSAAQHYMQQ